MSTLGPSAPSPIPQLHTQLMSTYFGRAAWASLTLQKPYITFWFSKWPESSCKPPSGETRKVLGTLHLLHPSPYKGLEPPPPHRPPGVSILQSYRLRPLCNEAKG